MRGSQRADELPRIPVPDKDGLISGDQVRAWPIEAVLAYLDEVGSKDLLRGVAAAGKLTQGLNPEVESDSIRIKGMYRWISRTVESDPWKRMKADLERQATLIPTNEMKSAREWVERAVGLSR